MNHQINPSDLIDYRNVLDLASSSKKDKKLCVFTTIYNKTYDNNGHSINIIDLENNLIVFYQKKEVFKTSNFQDAINCYNSI